jgi:hypothetical protein
VRWLAIILLVIPAVARAEHVLSLGVVRTDGAYNANPEDPEGLGARLALSLEDPPLVAPADGSLATSVRFVPEIFGGVLVGDHHAIGHLGLGMRGELQLARTYLIVLYVAARGMLRAEPNRGAAEVVLGEYLYLHARDVRLGLEIGPQEHHGSDGIAYLDTVESVYLGWTF